MIKKRRQKLARIEKSNDGFSFIEMLIGTALMLLVFVSMFGVFRLGIKMVGRSRGRSGAVALANEKMEDIRNLPYDEVGTIGGIPAGNIPQLEEISLNGIDYTRRVLVQYVDDPADGEGVSDENGINADYKRVKVEVTWLGVINPFFVVSDIMPKGIETTGGGGTIIINVFDASVSPVSFADVHIENNTTMPTISIDVVANIDGRVVFPGSPAASAYEIIVTKDGYSTAQTYDADATNVTPSPGHLTILEGETTQASFVIDALSNKMINTWEPIKEFSWDDQFNDGSKVSVMSSTTISGGKAILEEDAPFSYWTSGYLVSEDIGSISYLADWKEFSWNENTSVDTDIKYQVMYENVSWVPIPDIDLPGNSVGFDVSPVDLSGLSTTTYDTIRLQANLSTTDASVTPELLNWQITWDAGPTPFPNLPFHMQGEKEIGKDGDSDPIFKYSRDLTTDAGGQFSTTTLEWDIYDVTVNEGSLGYDVSEACPFQPANILPNSAVVTNLYFVPHTTNTFLISVKDVSGDPVSGVTTRLYKTGYDQLKLTSACGQSFFSSLSASSDYVIEISKSGYDTASSTVNVNGQTTADLTIYAS